MSTVISVEHVSKIYRLGQISSGTLSEDLKRSIARIRGKEDPLRKVTDNYDESAIHVALRDVSFDVREGEVLGIIGKNGAGKSTLLKILSRITAPTSGRVKLKGRVASLLEVGTGFHPELSGRENIFLNAAILGMSRAEVASKFDEIVEFSGVSKFIDTPVKRYSSGMYVRLAFAVAAHLEPEILIVDEVLAVGDADFQKKCLGKMKDVSAKDGRTVLFVSHNMVAIQSLCTSCVFLKDGKVELIGQARAVVDQYLLNEVSSTMENEWHHGCEADTEMVKIKSSRILLQNSDSDLIKISSSFAIEFAFEVDFPEEYNIGYSLNLSNIQGQIIFNSLSPSFMFKSGKLVSHINLPANFLNSGIYKVSIMIAQERTKPLFYLEDAMTFDVIDERETDEKWFGDLSMVLIRPKLDWSVPKN